ncbi:threonylcarbamoyl-AMP synthase [Candidatus Parcubacteria bacterium]|nr:threonylcarbamoyl-AMP synthase [Candidatus Parcubacteria bacterium]
MGDFVSKIEEAVAVLRQGGVIVFPTETAYGFGADATNERAVERLMAIKGREGWKTPPLIAADREMVERCVSLSAMFRDLADRFWPGPLTLVVPVFGKADLENGRSFGWAKGVVRDGTVAIRVSSHPTAQELSRRLGVPIVATSANVAGQPTCWNVLSVQRQFVSRLLQPDFYLDDGPLPVRAPSTVVAEQNGHLAVLRPGSIIV